MLGIMGCTAGGGSVSDVDMDEDGHYSDVDCDDQDPLIYPGALELCDGIDNDCDGAADEEDAIEATLWFVDQDGDGFGHPLAPIGGCEAPSGYIDNPDDCDDSSDAINPLASELCDGVDNDCDGVTDEDSATDAVTVFRDYDGDGFGNPHVTARQCGEDSQYVLNDADCDDSNPDIHPDGQEVCDPEGRVDEDCDGLIDDDDPSLIADQTWFLDEDNDGYGRTEDTVEACIAPEDHVASDGDCDDTDGTTNPEGVEVCADEIDNDCDGLLDVEDSDAQPVSWYVDGDGDGFGNGDRYWGEACTAATGLAANGTDCNDLNPAIFPGVSETWYDGVDSDCAGDNDYDADADGVEVDQDCDDADPEVSPAALEICGDGIDNDCDLLTDPCEVAFSLTGESAGDEAGWAMCMADLSGDGMGDLVLGAPYEDTGATGAGAVYVVFGPVTGAVSLADAVHIEGGDVGDSLGWSLAAGSDVTGDGIDDVVMGAYRADGTVPDLGAAYVLAGPISTGASLADAAAIWQGEAEDDAAAWVLAAGGDVNDDGEGDLLISAVDADGGAGKVYIAHGPMSGTTRLWGADLALEGEALGDAAGYAAALTTDLNGDGITDMVIGAPGHSEGAYEGAAYIVYGDPRLEGTVSLGDADGFFAGASGGDEAGTAVSGWSDVDGDGYAEVLVGAPGVDGDASETGAVYVLHGPASGTQSLDDAWVRWDGMAETDRAGAALAPLGDMDGDGVLDLLIGAPGSDTGVSGGGAAYIVRGPVSGISSLGTADAVLYGADRDMAMGTSLLGGDVDGDGTDDALIGAPSSSNGDVSVLFGGGW